MEVSLINFYCVHNELDYFNSFTNYLSIGEGFLFEDENYSEFIVGLQAMMEFEAFHELMLREARKDILRSRK